MDWSSFINDFGYYILVGIVGILLYVNRNNDMFKF